MQKDQCPCCGNNTLESDVYGHYGSLCEVCLWQSDEFQDNNSKEKKGFNPVSLEEAKKNYRKMGAIIQEYVKYARKPNEVEKKKPCCYDIIVMELFENHSLASLIILIDIGFELEFHYKDIPYSITVLNDKRFLSSPERKESQLFDNIIELIMNGTIDGRSFLEIWDELQLDFI